MLAGNAVQLALTRSWLDNVRENVDQALLQVLDQRADAKTDAAWRKASDHVRDLAMRPAKRLRPALLVAGLSMGRGRDTSSKGLWTFAAGLELLHLFMLIHDDVADRADLRRGGPSLHAMLGGDRAAQDLAIVVGDYLFARALEVMLEPELTYASKAVRYYLEICRQTAVGQFMDLGVSARPLKDTQLFLVVKIAMLKTARYSFVGPLVAGGVLANAPPELLDRFERAGRHLGVAYQLRDDYLGLYGDERIAGKSASSDFEEGKKTFPIVAAYQRSSAAVRAEIDALYAGDRSDPRALGRLRSIVEDCGGRAATKRAIERSTRAAALACKQLPNVSEPRRFLDWALSTLATRQA